MSQENPQIIPITGTRDSRIQDLQARKKQLLERKDHVRDSSVRQHLDVLLLEVEDLIAKQDPSTTIRRRIRREG